MKLLSLRTIAVRCAVSLSLTFIIACLILRAIDDTFLCILIVCLIVLVSVVVAMTVKQYTILRLRSKKQTCMKEDYADYYGENWVFRNGSIIQFNKGDDNDRLKGQE